MSGTAVAEPKVYIPLPFEVLSGYVHQLDTGRLQDLHQLVADAMAERGQAPLPEELDPETRAAIERSHEARLESLEAQEEIARGARALLKELGIHNLKPVGAKKLQEMMHAAGVREDDNEFSRAIVEMREE